jgi:FkbM family methyltransferase
MKSIFYPDQEETGYLPSIPFILKEIYIDKWYEPYLIGKKDMVIFDVGAHIGLTAEYLSRFAKTIWALEPDKENFDCLLANIKQNKLDKVKPLQVALTNNDGKVKFYKGGQNSAHNILGGQGEPVEVEAWTFDTLFKKTGVKRVNLLKLDIEGAEFEVLGGLPFKRNASKIDMIMGETHTWAGRNINQVFWALKDNGFKVELPKSNAEVYVARRI